MNILQHILAHKRQEVARARQACPLEAMRARAQAAPDRPGFSEAFRKAPMGLLAEVKRRSPSAGLIRDPFDPPAIARDYEAAGAQALSVLMDEKYFGGGAEDFSAVREAVAIPLLYKEFVVDPWQVWQAVDLGASLILLIAGALSRESLEQMIQECLRADIEYLLEVHDAEEMKMARMVKAPIVGINNRDLRNFVTTLETTLRLKDEAPPGAMLISESGIKTAADVARLRAEGINGVLVGEHLLRQADLQAAVKDLMGDVWACS